MKVYILTKEPFPYGMASTNRIKCLAWAIKQEGIECEVNIFQRTDKKENSNNTNNNGIYHFIVKGEKDILKIFKGRADAVAFIKRKCKQE